MEWTRISIKAEENFPNKKLIQFSFVWKYENLSEELSTSLIWIFHQNFVKHDGKWQSWELQAFKTREYTL